MGKPTVRELLIPPFSQNQATALAERVEAVLRELDDVDEEQAERPAKWRDVQVARIRRALNGEA